MPRETLLLCAAAYNLGPLGTKSVLAKYLYNHVQRIPAESYNAPASPQQPSQLSSAINNNVILISLQELRTIISEEIPTNKPQLPQPQHHHPLSLPSVILKHEMDTQEATIRPLFRSTTIPKAYNIYLKVI